jgi:hypothetical protein
MCLRAVTLGCNDCGKTSLLRAIANEQIDGFPDSTQVGHVCERMHGRMHTRGRMHGRARILSCACARARICTPTLPPDGCKWVQVGALAFGEGSRA